ncbi:MAG TPA: PQQ-binding-like beta-propeller repeat protein [Ktedonobacterales bacterium]
MQKRLASFIVLCSLFLLAACSTPTTATTPAATATPAPKPVTLFYGTYDQASGQEIITALDGASGKPRWTYTTSADDAIQPALEEGVVYVATSASLIALNASDGKLLWSNPTFANAGIVGGANGVLYISFFTSRSDGSLKTSLVALNASDGSMRWSYEFHNGEGTLLADGVIYGSDTLTPTGTPTSPDGSTLLALNASDGSVKWQSAQESGYLTPLSVANGLLYADNSFPMGGPETIEARSISDGSLAWKYPSDTGRATSVGMDDNTLYVSNESGTADLFLVALNASTGAILWQVHNQPNWETWQSFVAPQMAFVGDGVDDSLTAFNSADGKQLWKTRLGTPSSNAAALVSVGVVTNGVVYLASPDGFTALNASTGAIQWTAHDALTHDPGGHPILAVRAGILYSRSDTTLVARSAQSGAVLWSQNVGLTDDPIIG